MIYNSFVKKAMIKNLLSRLWFKKKFHYILNHKKIILPITIAILVIIYFLFPKQTSKVLTEEVTRKDVVKIVSVTGDVAADNSVNLSFQSGEALGWVGVKEGDVVTKWQAIASLDQNKLQASFRQAQQDFVAAKAASDQYYDGHKNATESYDEKVKRTALDATQNKAYDQMVKTQYDISHSTLYSPIDGIITRADAQIAGVNVTSATIFTITDPSSLNFKMEIDEADIGQVREGQQVNVSYDSFLNKTVTLTIDSVDFVSHKTSSGGNAFYAKAHLPNAEGYRVGMSGNADIIVESKKQVLSVSSSSIFDEKYVYVLENGKFKKTKITLGLESDIDTEIISGLNEGEVVALDPNSVPQNEILK